MKIVLQHLTKKFPARGPVRGRKNREDVIAVKDFDFEIPDGLWLWQKYGTESDLRSAEAHRGQDLFRRR